MPHKFEALLYAIFFTFWSVRLYYKLYDKKIRKYILSIGVLIVLWMLIRMCKGVVETAFAKRIVWYLYYLPMIFIPTIFYICSKQNVKRKYLYIISSILLILVLTNDLHQLVFRFPCGLEEFDTYKHNIGYYIIAGWIFGLFIMGIVNQIIGRLKIKKDFKAFMPLIIILIGLIYTILYILDIRYIRSMNMSVINSILIFLGIELSLYLDLIPNNSRYIKTFENSCLDMAIISLDGNTKYLTKAFNKIPKFILDDIKNNKTKEKYYNGQIKYEVKKNKDSYVIIKNDLKELYKLKKDIRKKQRDLLKYKKNIEIEKQTKKELYEIELRKKVVDKIENELNEKWIEAKSELKDNRDFDRIKRILIYSKKKSQLIISELNDEIYNSDNIKVVLNELLKSMNINGLVIVQNNIFIKANILSKIYDVIYDMIDYISNKTIMIYIIKEKNIKMKISIEGKINYKGSFDAINIYDNDMEFILDIKDGEV